MAEAAVKSMNRLMEIVARLEKRLEPSMLPAPGAGTGPVHPASTEAARSLLFMAFNRLRVDAELAGDRINVLLDRLEF